MILAGRPLTLVDERTLIVIEISINRWKIATRPWDSLPSIVNDSTCIYWIQS